ncbi:hypothetical protein QBC38DRAFT_481890 [Podospora fimiseda]|uniref:Uncharacterized protein n=1 Tax=Podospora fimiseda TaxID=252190 RepID=A0AAN7BM25_9PEZI|nr:hypothetical protein QBC38DRAFT_481890 [Podospora fimiseda]
MTAVLEEEEEEEDASEDMGEEIEQFEQKVEDEVEDEEEMGEELGEEMGQLEEEEAEEEAAASGEMYQEVEQEMDQDMGQVEDEMWEEVEDELEEPFNWDRWQMSVNDPHLREMEETLHDLDFSVSSHRPSLITQQRTHTSKENMSYSSSQSSSTDSYMYSQQEQEEQQQQHMVSELPPHLQPDPQIWSLDLFPEPQRPDNRPWPPQKGTIYCEKCFQQDCIKYTQIRDNITTILYLLHGQNLPLIKASLAKGRSKKLFALDIPTDTIGYVLLHTISEQQLDKLDLPSKYEVTRALDTLRRDIGVTLKQLKKLSKQFKSLLLQNYTPENSYPRRSDKIPNDIFISKIGQEITRAKWESKQQEQPQQETGSSLVYPCAYCSESGAANAFSKKCSTRQKPWLKALMWMHKIDSNFAASLKPKDFLDVVSGSRYSTEAEVFGIRVMVVGSGLGREEDNNNTRIVLVGMPSIFDSAG